MKAGTNRGKILFSLGLYQYLFIISEKQQQQLHQGNTACHQSNTPESVSYDSCHIPCTAIGTSFQGWVSTSFLPL